MSKVIDCLIIGHNEMNFAEYEKTLRKTDQRSGSYRDLSMSFIRYNQRPYHASEIFNFFCRTDESCNETLPPLRMLDTFSATIAYLGTYLNKHGCTFDFVHSFQEEREELIKKLTRENILAIAITTTLYVSFFPIVEIVEFIKRYNDNVPIVVGGPFVSTKVRTMNTTELNYLFVTIGADVYVNSSQGEATLIKLIYSLKNNSSLNGVNNIYYKTNNGYQSTPIVKEDNRLSENMVDWKLFAHRLGEHATVRTSISCPFSCAFCGFPQHAGRYQTAEVEKIQQELNTLDKIGKVKSVHFIDDTLNVPIKRYKEILKMMIKNKYKFKWHSYFRCQYADREMVELMKESGCEGVFLGFESGSDSILKNMNKKVTRKEYFKGAQLLKQFGITMYGNFIIGFPGETDETVEETITFIRESQPDFYHAQIWYGEPITPIWKQKDKFRIKGESFEWSHATMNSQTACDLVEKMFLSIKDVLWVPQYNFSLDNIFHLEHRGIDRQSINNFLKAFNSGIEEKLNNPACKEISFEVIKRLKNYRHKSENSSKFSEMGKVHINISDAEFVF